MSGYKDIQVYEKSYKAALAIYRMTEGFPEEEVYGVTNQIRRASLSIPLNIAEGYAKRESQNEYKRFLMMAIGSSNEVSVLLEFTKDRGYIGSDVYEKVSSEYEVISKMLNRYIQAVVKESKI